MVPNGWNKQQISDICTLQNGNSFKPHQWDTKGLPIIRIQNLNGSENFNYYSGEVNEKWLVETGQLLFSWAGTKGVSFGPFIWKKERGVLNQHIYKVYALDQVDQDWLYESLRWVTNKIEAQAHGFKATLLHVQKKDIDNQPILVPPLPEQRKIAQILSTWDRGIATTEKLIDISKQQKKALMQQLLTGKKRLVDPETGKAFEGEWVQVSFGDIAKVSSKKYDPNKTEISFPCIELEHIDQASGVILGTVESKQLASIKSIFQSGDVLFGKLRPYLKKYAYPKFSGVCSTEIWVLKANKLVISEYLYQFIQTNIFISEANKSAGSKMPRADWGVVSELVLKIPCHQEQQKISSVLTAADKEIELLEAKLAHFKQEKKALMQQLLTGKKRVNLAQTMEVTV